MGKNSKVGWTDHTFNIVWGCTEVEDDPACDNCYAREYATGRFKLPIWGQNADRRTFGEAHWNAPLDWNADAQKAGAPAFVFCSSMADVFEDHPVVRQERQKLWPLPGRTKALVWMLLTKRIDRVLADVPPTWLLPECWPENVWVGTTVAHQDFLAPRVRELAKIPAPIRFVSFEPMLGPIDATPYLSPRNLKTNSVGTCGRCGYHGPGPAHRCAAAPIEWAIGGGESQKRARPVHPAWARYLRDQCVEAGVPFFWKQWGEWSELAPEEEPQHGDAWVLGEGHRVLGNNVKSLHGHVQAWKPPDPLVRPPEPPQKGAEPGRWDPFGDVLVRRRGTKNTGMLLDGREWTQRPEVWLKDLGAHAPPTQGTLFA
jgi:protein gp37